MENDVIRKLPHCAKGVLEGAWKGQSIAYIIDMLRGWPVIEGRGHWGAPKKSKSRRFGGAGGARSNGARSNGWSGGGLHECRHIPACHHSAVLHPIHKLRV